MKLNLDEITKALGEITQEKWERDGRFVYALADDPSPRRDFPSMSNKFQASVQPCGIPISTEELEANAHLIANAPEWLRLLVERVRKLESLEKAVQRAIKSDAMKRFPHAPRSILKDYPEILEAALNLEAKEQA